MNSDAEEEDSKFVSRWLAVWIFGTSIGEANGWKNALKSTWRMA